MKALIVERVERDSLFQRLREDATSIQLPAFLIQGVMMAFDAISLLPSPPGWLLSLLPF